MTGKTLRVLHTSDWHIGQKLYNNNRYEDFEKFFAWLVQTIQDNGVDALLVAGDIFDVRSPSNRAQEIYYRFLWDVSKTCCRHVIITAGNHDAPEFLDAPAPLLKNFNIHVVGVPADEPADEVLQLRDRQGNPELLVCAVPYLREKDVRIAGAGESVDEKNARLHEGIAAHYAKVGEAAAAILKEFGQAIPVVGMGHLWTSGAQVEEGENARPLYIGSLGQVDASIFPDIFDYVALGHLHGSQRVGGREHIRYSGSPLPMSFDEARRKKKVYLVEFCGSRSDISEIDVPEFRRLVSVRGDWDIICGKLGELAEMYPAGKDVPWVEVIYESEKVIPQLSEQVDALIAGSAVMVLRKRDERRICRIDRERARYPGLRELTPRQVFEICMKREIPESEWAEYLETFDLVCHQLEEDGCGEE